MSSLAVRSAAPADAEQVAAISRRPFAAAWTQQAYTCEAGRADSIFLIADDGRVLGYALARLVGMEVQLLDLAVAEDGHGIGRALWSALCSAAWARGAARLTLEVSERNARALSFYERAGARLVGRRPGFYHDGSAAVLLNVILTKTVD